MALKVVHYFFKSLMTTIAIVGDYNPKNPSHTATDDAIGRSSIALGLSAEHCWVATVEGIFNPR